MNHILAAIQILKSDPATKHLRKGFLYEELDTFDMISHADEELTELSHACSNFESPERVRSELGDLISILIHFAEHYGFELAEIEHAVICKYLKRFKLSPRQRKKLTILRDHLKLRMEHRNV